MVKVRVYDSGGTMSLYQKSPLQKVAIWAGLTLIGLPLTAILTNPFYPNQLPIFALALVSWLAFCVAMRALARWLSLRTTLMGAAILLAGVPLALLLFMLTNNLNLTNHMVYLNGNGAFLIVYWFLGLWSILSGLLTRNERGMYVAVHLSNWLFWLGIIGALGYGQSLPLLTIPLGIMLLLLGLYKPIIQKLASLPFLQKNWQSNAVPKSADYQDYEQGYRPSYNEGGNVSTYPHEEEVPTLSSPRAELQQQR